MTAGNSTPLTDGASVGAARLGGVGRGRTTCRCSAYLTAYETAAVDYVHGGEGLLMAPAYAMPRMLRARGPDAAGLRLLRDPRGLRLARCCATLKAWEDPVFCKERLGLDAPLGAIDRAKLNVNGSSLAAGHPFAATGGRIVADAREAARGAEGGPAAA